MSGCQVLCLSQLGQGGSVTLIGKLVEGLRQVVQGWIAAVLGGGAKDLVPDPFRELSGAHRGDGAMLPALAGVMGVTSSPVATFALMSVRAIAQRAFPRVKMKGRQR